MKVKYVLYNVRPVTSVTPQSKYRFKGNQSLHIKSLSVDSLIGFIYQWKFEPNQTRKWKLQHNEEVNNRGRQSKS